MQARPGRPDDRPAHDRRNLQAVLGDAAGLELEFIVPELTMAPHNPAMSDLVPLYEASRDKAHADATVKAKELAERLASNSA